MCPLRLFLQNLQFTGCFLLTCRTVEDAFCRQRTLRSVETAEHLRHQKKLHEWGFHPSGQQIAASDINPPCRLMLRRLKQVAGMLTSLDRTSGRAFMEVCSAGGSGVKVTIRRNNCQSSEFRYQRVSAVFAELVSDA